MRAPGRGRIEVIDGARGAAMLLVFLSHFLETYFHAFPARTHAFRVVTRIASPAFAAISGVTLATLHARGLDWAKRIRDRLLDRAAFLLLVCHPVMVGAYVIRATTLHEGMRILFITDTIAVCLVVGALLLPRLGSAWRVILGLGLLVTAWSLTVVWNPGVGSWAWRLKDTLVGDWRDHWAGYSFPLVPWLGFYVIASAVGTWFVQSWNAGRQRRVGWLALVSGIGAFAAARVLERVGDAAAHLPLVHAHVVALALLASPEKLPPTPVYFLRYGGLASMLFALVLAMDATIRGRRLLRWSALLGRCSVVAYVLQYYVYYDLQYWLPRPPERWAPLYFASTVLLISAIVWQWERANGNRLLTVGYPGLVKWLRGTEAPSVAQRTLSERGIPYPENDAGAQSLGGIHKEKSAGTIRSGV